LKIPAQSGAESTLTENVASPFQAEPRQTRDGEPLLLTDGQLQICEAIVTRSHPFWHVMTHTQYGKSETAGIAALTMASNYPEKVAIIAGKKDKAQIIMDYAIPHIFDNELTRSRFIVGEGENLDYIRRHRNKQHLSFDVGNGQPKLKASLLHSRIPAKGRRFFLVIAFEILLGFSQTVPNRPI